jgi:hypothetical protein
MYVRPKADQFMREVRRLRVQRASEEKCQGTAEVLYPNGSAAASSLESTRSRFVRACLVPNTSFQRAEDAYKAGANVMQIVATLDKTSAGAPKGNLNAQGQKRSSSLDRIEACGAVCRPRNKRSFFECITFRASHEQKRRKAGRSDHLL